MPFQMYLEASPLPWPGVGSLVGVEPTSMRHEDDDPDFDDDEHDYEECGMSDDDDVCPCAGDVYDNPRPVRG